MATPQMQIRFEHLDVTYSSLLHRRSKVVLQNLSGVFEPGSMTLVLAHPGAGKSTFLKALAGRVNVSGSITYNGKTQSQIQAQLPQIVSYVAQNDVLNDKLTVHETIDFAKKCFGNYQEADASATKSSDLEPSSWMQQAGFHPLENSFVGDANIGDGEKRRLSALEMLCGHHSVLLLDEITTGLDSATALNMIKLYRHLATQMGKTVVMALQQPSPEVYALFDDIFMLNQGQLLFHGSRSEAVPYFESLGFQCPPDCNTADFLMSMSTHQQRSYISDIAKLPPPEKPFEFAQSFASSSIYESTLQTLASPVAEELLESNTRYFDTVPVFRQTFWQDFTTLLSRQFTVMLRNRATLLMRAVFVVLIGGVFASVFRRVDLSNTQAVKGLMSMSMLFLVFMQSAQVSISMGAREIFYKQRDANMYRTLPYTLATILTQLPACLIETAVYIAVVYWSCGLADSAKAFLLYEVLVLTMVMSLVAFFYLLSCLMPNDFVAKPVATMAVLFFNFFAGFMITRDRFPDYFIWLYWINPLSWGLRGLTLSQYHDSKLQIDTYKGIPFKARFGVTMGDYTLSLFNVQTDIAWVWRGVVFELVFFVALSLLSAVALEYTRFQKPIGAKYDKTKDEQREQREAMNSYTSNSAFALVTTPVASSPSSELSVTFQPGQPTSRGPKPVTIAFKNLWYSVRNIHSKETTDILKDVSGVAMPGTLTAVMGSAGAGKTTLMDILAGRKPAGNIRGEVRLNGHIPSSLVFQRSVGYCDQYDTHSEGSTFYEALVFSANLRQSSDIPKSEKMAIVEECLDLLHMRRIADKMIRGSSLDELKRLSIAVEVVAQPSVLLLDEPTTGLDARSSGIIMTALRELADGGRTVICAINEPSRKAFATFDNLLLLKTGGEPVFFGSLGPNAEKTIEYFESIPGVVPMDKEENPATWMVKQTEDVLDMDSGNLASTFQSSPAGRELQVALFQEGIGREDEDADSKLAFKDKRAASSLTQMVYVVKRSLLLYWRTPAYNMTRLVASVVLGLLFGLTFRNAKFTTYRLATIGVAMMSLSSIFMGVVSFTSVAKIVSTDLPAFNRERASQTYNALWYFIGSVVAEIPSILVVSLVFVAIFFPLVGFTGLTRFLLYWATISLHVYVETFMGMFFVWAVPNAALAGILGLLMNITIIFFMGFNPAASLLPSYYEWLFNILPLRYSLGLQAGIIFADCADPTSSYVACTVLQQVPTTLPRRLTYKQLVELMYKAKYDDIARNFAILAAFAVVISLLGLLALRFLSRQRK